MVYGEGPLAGAGTFSGNTQLQLRATWKGKSWKIHTLIVTSFYLPGSCMCLPFAKPNLNTEGKGICFCSLHGSVSQGTEEGGKGRQWPWQGK